MPRELVAVRKATDLMVGHVNQLVNASPIYYSWIILVVGTFMSFKIFGRLAILFTFRLTFNVDAHLDTSLNNFG